MSDRLDRTEQLHDAEMEAAKQREEQAKREEKRRIDGGDEGDGKTDAPADSGA